MSKENNDKYLEDNIEASKKDFNKACEVYRKYVGDAETLEERKRRINRFRCG